MRIEDMRLFVAVVGEGGFTNAARSLGLPKQTVSRRVAEMEAELGVALLHRTTRRVEPTEAGRDYARRAAEVVRLAELADAGARSGQRVPRGVLRVTADPVFGEAFLGGLVVEYAARYPDVAVEVALTRRKVALVEEGFDVAFRVGGVDDPSLTVKKLGPARVCYCASPSYVAQRGAPASPRALRDHACIVTDASGPVVRWPFRGKEGVRAVAVTPRLRLDGFAMAREAALAGLGIALFPAFACAEDLARGRLLPVLEAWTVDVGGVWLVRPTAATVPARVRAFIDLAVERLGRSPPWA